jgi:hypothetical protein
LDTSSPQPSPPFLRLRVGNVCAVEVEKPLSPISAGEGAKVFPDSEEGL